MLTQIHTCEPVLRRPTSSRHRGHRTQSYSTDSIESDSMFRSVKVQACKKEEKGGEKIALFLISSAVTLIMYFKHDLS